MHKLKVAIVCHIICLLSVKVNAQAIQHFDDKVLMDIAAHRTEPQTRLFLFLTKTNNYVNFGVPVGLFVGGAVGENKAMRQNAAYIASSSVVSFIATNLIKIIVKRPRPFVNNLKIVPVYRAGGYSFPSGHTSSSFSTATSVSSLYPKWYVIVPSYLWASSVSYSRLYLGVHNPSDVAAGAVLGAGTGMLAEAMSR